METLQKRTQGAGTSRHHGGTINGPLNPFEHRSNIVPRVSGLLFRIIIISTLCRIELMKKIPAWNNIYPNLCITIYIHIYIKYKYNTVIQEAGAFEGLPWNPRLNNLYIEVQFPSNFPSNSPQSFH